MKNKNIIIYILLGIIFLTPLGGLVYLCIAFLPRQIAVMVIALAGFTVMVVGPFWAMDLERRLREKFEEDREQR